MQIFTNLARLFLVFGTLILTFIAGKNSPKSAVPTATPSPTPKSEISIVLGGKTESKTVSALGDFIYPGANITKQEENLITMSSDKSPDVVTDYYKQKITALNPAAKSFVTTKTNGLVENKLAFFREGYQITIEVKNGNSSTGSQIIVSQN